MTSMDEADIILGSGIGKLKVLSGGGEDLGAP